MVDYENELKVKGLTRIQLYELLFETVEEKAIFVEECRGMDSFSIRSYASKVRRGKLYNRTYNNDEFIDLFHTDKPKALSQLFLEAISQDKAEQLTIINPHEILDIHSKCSKDIYFVKFLIAVKRIK